MTLSILRVHIKLALRSLTSKDDQRVFLVPLFFLGIAMLSLVVFLLSAAIFDGFSKKLPSAAIMHFPSLVFLIAFVVLLYTSLDKAFKNLFIFNDFSLLRSSPVSPRNFFIAKFFSVWLESSWMSTAIAIPIGFGYGHLLSGWLRYDILFLLAYINFSVMVTLLGVMIVLSIVKWISIAKFNEFLVASRILLIVVALWLLPIGMPGQAPKTLSRAAATEAVNNFFDKVRFPFLPSTWIDNFLSVAADGRLVRLLWLLPLLALAAFLAILIQFQYQNLFENLSNRSMVSRSPGPRKQRKQLPWSNELTSIVKKDSLAWQRTPSLKIQTAAGAVVVIMLAMKFLGGIGTNASLGLDKPLLSLAVGILVGTMMASRFSIGSLSIEGRALWVILSSPISTRRLLGGKLLFSWLPMFAISTISGITIAITLGTSLQNTSWLLAQLTTTAATISAMGIASGTAFQNTEWTDMNPATSNMAGIAFSVSFILYIALVYLVDRLLSNFIGIVALLLLFLVALRFCESLIDQLRLSCDA